MLILQLAHVHLVSSHRFATVAHLSTDTVVDYLLAAPRITKDVATMAWMYLEAPHDGAVLLVWEPPALGNRFASDGYVWGEMEQRYSQNHKGYVRR
jgi:hypothetical protein